MSVLALSRKYGISRRTVDRRIERSGRALRSVSEANKLRNQRMTPAERAANTRAANEARRVGSTVVLVTRGRGACETASAFGVVHPPVDSGVTLLTSHQVTGI